MKGFKPDKGAANILELGGQEALYTRAGALSNPPCRARPAGASTKVT